MRIILKLYQAEYLTRILQHEIYETHIIFQNIGVNTENCSDMSGTEEFNCQCYSGFEGKRCEIDLCDGIFCENGFCDAGNCICDSGFINIENICVETCDLNPCEVFQNKHTI